MHPYFFPYIGYYQMAAAVKRFLFYDDVQYIKGGHIARNKLLINGKEWLFTVQLSGTSPNQLNQDVRLDEGKWPHWKDKFLRTIDQNYRKAENYAPVANCWRRSCKCPMIGSPAWPSAPFGW